ncbi:N-acetylmannosamine-6-phosphate 2-epimerase [Streptobacillus moniliformis]|nr:N-acetylmannosamine-6-phosphate 2-epimerase [Streptobacillus moniliformis]AVL43488.1 N-acetylmannosamine-6-phosphate 2-epimerase [Streptobacillus moniliformis]QXW66435.1 N-acetylmannosamine-6-phosphate 2-epimerase [Streptobacillus moniliformis]
MVSNKVLEKLKGQLIVSCQALPGEPLYMENSTIMPLMARAAIKAGAKGIRTNGVLDVKEIKKEVEVPVIGLIKKGYEGFPQYITVGMSEIDALVEAGADIIALDCTLRDRYDGKTINEFIADIKAKYPHILLMADISNLEEGINAEKAGVDIIGTTLNGYTPYTETSDKGPNYTLIEELVSVVKIPVIAEGRIHTPEAAKKMLDLGAYAVVVGGAITRPLEITNRFIEGMGLK